MRGSAWLTIVLAVWPLAAVVSGQTTRPGQTHQTRPATATFAGDTGLWFVPTGEVLPRHECSLSAQRRGVNYTPGFSNVGDFGGTTACGLTWRLEVFGGWLVDTRIDRDLRPLFTNDETAGGYLASYPRVRRGWTSGLGDMTIGMKFNVFSQSRQNSYALAIRPVLKLPTGDPDDGTSTGAADVAVDLVISREARRVEVAAFAGGEQRGEPTGFDLPRGAVRLGGGIAVPSGAGFRVTAEAMALVPTSDVATRVDPLVAVDGSVAPASSLVDTGFRVVLGLTWQRDSLFIGGGVGIDGPMHSRPDGSISRFRDYADWQIRVGFHPGVLIFSSSGN